MGKRRIVDDELHAHFITYSCYQRRRTLDHPRAKQIVLGVFGRQLRLQEAKCLGFVIMPDHVHAMVWFPRPDQLSHFMKQWKQQTSAQIKRLLTDALRHYAKNVDRGQPVWQARYYSFNVYSDEKVREKLEYMHQNPVRAGLIDSASDWRYSSARYYDLGKSVGVPIHRFCW